MRYALLAVLLLGCSGDAFSAAPPASSGGTTASGGAATGGTTASGGTGGAGGTEESSPDASVDGPPDDVLDGAPDAPPPEEAQAPLTSCPPAPPSTASSCTGTFDCAYGNDARVSCRPVYQCRSGAWLISAKQCPLPKHCSELAVPPVTGAPCATRDDYCTYAVGDDCGCVQGATLAWKCAPKPASPCPPRAANKGQPCDDADAGTCSYGVCGSPDQVQTSCKNGVTTWTMGCN